MKLIRSSSLSSGGTRLTFRHLMDFYQNINKDKNRNKRTDVKQKQFIDLRNPVIFIGEM